MKQNYYGSLCTEMYEILHKEAPQEELDFYLSYAHKEDKILEVLCGSGRFQIPFIRQGYDIIGLDLSFEMLSKLKEKEPKAKYIQADILEYNSNEKYDYIFVSSSSVSLFTDISLCKKILGKIKEMLKANGTFVFAVDTMANILADDEYYNITASVKTKDNCKLVLKSKNYYDEYTQTQYMPGIYELYNDKNELLQKEHMDFQTHLYKFNEMEEYLKEIGFNNIKTYSSYSKDIAIDDNCECFLFECKLS